ncbi:hypothetical protein PV04_00005 [Phialophora macrospora]|uniref:Major facilitator superfamily (MFS) profile domain-containing protein n=1 Tax=Phialophora macrospora TaxID=1851006 RepID=A0A0D2FTK9_9EURO|nr:hypothetical protein PV04_00005 [Phialophora macrospora]
MTSEISTKQPNADVELSCIEDADHKPTTAYTLQPEKKPVRSGLERRLMWKQDLLILPLLALIYFVTFLDRNSFGNGRLLGLQKEIGFSNAQYSHAAQYFFIGYTICMFPGSISLRWIPPHWVMGGACISFGILLCGMSAAKNYATIVATRILIGCAQSFTQNSGVYNSFWYTRREVATRGALIFSTATLSGAFSGLIAYAIGEDLRHSSRSPWSWLFLIEGVIAIFVGVVVIILLPVFPDRMKNGKNWLFTRDEISLALERTSSWNTTGSKILWPQVWDCLKDPKSYAFAMFNATSGLCLSSIGIFLPTFIRDFGYSDLDAQLFSVIPYASAFCTLLILCYISDWVNLKGPFIMFGFAVNVIGYAMLLGVKSTAAKVVATCFITSGMYPAVVLFLTWLAINTGGFTKRATTWAMAEIFGQLFSILGANIYDDGPRYVKGHVTAMSFSILSLFIAVALMVVFSRQNKKRNGILKDFARRGEIHPHTNRSLEYEKDFHINFRYTL